MDHISIFYSHVVLIWKTQPAWNIPASACPVAPCHGDKCSFQWCGCTRPHQRKEATNRHGSWPWTYNLGWHSAGAPKHWLGSVQNEPLKPIHLSDRVWKPPWLPPPPHGKCIARSGPHHANDETPAIPRTVWRVRWKPHWHDAGSCPQKYLAYMPWCRTSWPMAYAAQWGSPKLFPLHPARKPETSPPVHLFLANHIGDRCVLGSTAAGPCGPHQAQCKKRDSASGRLLKHRKQCDPRPAAQDPAPAQCDFHLLRRLELRWWWSNPPSPWGKSAEAEVHWLDLLDFAKSHLVSEGFPPRNSPAKMNLHRNLIL